MDKCCSTKEQENLVFDGEILFNEYRRPYLEMKNCEIRHPSPQEFRDCFKEKNIVFLGDSTTNFQ